MESTPSKRTTSEETMKLWREYKRTGDQELRNRLVLTFAPMVKYIVYRKLRGLPVRCDADDYLSAGLEAVIGALDRYDPAKGSALDRYLWTRIHGAVLDEMRRNDWAPRSLRRWERDVDKARDEFFGLYGKMPTRSELSDALGISRDELTTHLNEISQSQVGSLNALVLSDEATIVERVDLLLSDDDEADPEVSALREAARERLRLALRGLSEREQKVAVLIYVYNLTLREIGEVIGVTESRVCQIHGQMLRKLRSSIREEEDLFAYAAA